MKTPLDFAPPSVLSRRAALTALAGFGAAAVLAACGSDSKSTSTSTSTSSSTSTAAVDTSAAGTTATTSATTAASSATTAASATTASAAATCDPIPEETGGPFPGDGSNGPNILIETGVVRSDIRTSIGSASGTADGVPLTINLSLVDAATGCVPMAGAAVYVWHCDRDGNYSMYSAAAANENYLRGVQEADANGQLSFISIFPAAYSGRWPHIHFEVYASVADATGGGAPIATSQLALPEDACDLVYQTADGYSQSITNMDRTTLDSDNVFGDDDGEHQLATMSGDVGSGLIAALTVPV